MVRTVSPGCRSANSGRYRSIVDVYVLLRRPDEMILLLEWSGTGYAEGQLCVCPPPWSPPAPRGWRTSGPALMSTGSWSASWTTRSAG